MSPTSYQTAPPRDDIKVSDDVSEYDIDCLFLYIFILEVYPSRHVVVISQKLALHAPPRDDIKNKN